MARYSGTSSQRESSIKSKETSGIWRGIGCVLMVVVPVISMVIGTEVVKYAIVNRLFPIPDELLGYPVLPAFINQSFGLHYVFGPLAKIRNFYAYVVAGIICMIAISSVISMGYAIAYRIANPDPYGPTDAPPPRRKIEKKSR
jgi:hypothetical protein